MSRNSTSCSHVQEHFYVAVYDCDCCSVSIQKWSVSIYLQEPVFRKSMSWLCTTHFAKNEVSSSQRGGRVCGDPTLVYSNCHGIGGCIQSALCYAVLTVLRGVLVWAHCSSRCEFLVFVSWVRRYIALSLCHLNHLSLMSSIPKLLYTIVLVSFSCVIFQVSSLCFSSILVVLFCNLP